LLPVVYKELQRLAHFQLRKERPDHTLESAALVNEAYVRLVGLNAPQWEGRTHFFAIAAQQMRQILVDYARRHRAGKRGGAAKTLSLDDAGRQLSLIRQQFRLSRDTLTVTPRSVENATPKLKGLPVLRE
jgi:RNA polymerase sigma factor (TIGR02999 family)